MYEITDKQIEEFGRYLLEEEKAAATAAKYTRDVREFVRWGGVATKASALSYRAELEKTRKPSSVNAAIASLNSFFRFICRADCVQKSIKTAKKIFAPEEKELTKAEYERLLRAARSRGNERLCLIMQTICSTGIRVSELRFITVETVAARRAVIDCKGRQRIVLLPRELCRMLKRYAAAHGITSGAVFVTRSGKPVDRSNIWTDMKKLCDDANVPRGKVFPHNLRHLFARTFYSMQKDIVRLADVLGHASVNTTRIYTMESAGRHREKIEKLGLLRAWDCLSTT